jgi:hypothetical protein
MLCFLPLSFLHGGQVVPRGAGENTSLSLPAPFRSPPFLDQWRTVIIDLAL